MVALVLYGLGASCLWPTLLAYAGDRVSRGGATMFSLLSASGNGGGALAPLLIGAVAGRTNLRWGLTALGVYPLLAAGLFAWRALVERPQSR